jgi:hypothetical protein
MKKSVLKSRILSMYAWASTLFRYDCSITYSAGLTLGQNKHVLMGHQGARGTPQKSSHNVIYMILSSVILGSNIPPK